MKDGYLNFDEYIRQGDPAQRERAEAWSVAIGLQAVDGLQVSNYLLELARRMRIFFFFCYIQINPVILAKGIC